MYLQKDLNIFFEQMFDFQRKQLVLPLKAKANQEMRIPFKWSNLKVWCKICKVAFSDENVWKTSKHLRKTYLGLIFIRHLLILVCSSVTRLVNLSPFGQFYQAFLDNFGSDLGNWDQFFIILGKLPRHFWARFV